MTIVINFNKKRSAIIRILYEIDNKESIKIDIKYVTAGEITLSSCMVTYTNTK